MLEFRRGDAALQAIAVELRERGRGIGGRLMHASARGTKQGAATLRLCTAQANVEALALFIKHGFRIERRMPRFYPNGQDACSSQNRCYGRSVRMMEALVGKNPFRFAVALAALLGASSLVTGCVLFAPSEEDVRADFQDYVNGANACTSTDECAYAGAGCPLGCQIAVRKDRVGDVEKKARELIDDYESGGRACDYGCVPPQGVACRAGRCRDLTTDP